MVVSQGFKRGVYKSEFFRAFVLFNFSVIVILISNAIVMGVGLRTDFTISRYVGLNLVTAVGFLISNVFVARYMYLGFRELKKKLRLSDVWMIIGMIMLAMLILLSACPSGYFDKFMPTGERSVVSEIHLLAAKGMFVLAIVSQVEVLVKLWKNRKMRGIILGFIVYGVTYVILYLTGSEILKKFALILEWGFLEYYILVFVEMGREKIRRENKK